MNNQSYSAIASAFIYLLTLLSFLFTWQSAHAAAKGDYRSKGIGYTFYWSSPASWEYYTGSAWVAATDYPGQNRKTGTVTIRKSHYCLLDVSPANPIENLVLAAGNTTTTGVGYSTLFGFNAGTPLTLKVAGDVILNKNSFMGVNIYEPEPADVRHRFEIEGNLTGTASPCGVVFYFYNSDVVDLVFTGGDNSTISGLNPFIQSTTGIFSPFTSSSLNRVTVNKSKNKSTLTLGQNIYCNRNASNASLTGDFTITNGTVDLASYSAHGAGKLSIGANQTLRLNGSNNFPLYSSYLLDASSEVEYYSTGNQTIGSATYGNLTFSGSGVKSLGGNIVVNSMMDVDNGIEIALNNKSLTLNKDYSAGTIFRGSATSDLIFGSGAILPGSLTFNSAFASLRNLTFNNSADITFGSPLTINGTLTFPPIGKIFTSASHLLTFNTSAGYAGNDADSFVDGPASKTGSSDFIFPVGDGSIWARIGISSLTSTTTFTAEYFDAPYSSSSNDGTLGSISEREHWILNRMAGTGNANVRLFWENGIHSEIDNDAYTKLMVARFNGVNWENEGRSAISGSSSAGDIISNTITGFSPFTFGIEPTILPVELLYFEPAVHENEVHLTWETASEKNNDFFTIERSADGFNFHEVLQVKGAGNANAPITYEAIDQFPQTGISYYRLKQTDFDGTESYSPVAVVSFTGNHPMELSIFPNPSHDGIIRIKAAEPLHARNTQIKIVDISGLEQTGYQIEGYDHMMLNLTAFRKGTYFVQVTTPFQTKTFRILLN